MIARVVSLIAAAALLVAALGPRPALLNVREVAAPAAPALGEACPPEHQDRATQSHPATIYRTALQQHAGLTQFVALDLIIDSGQKPLAAYQIELNAATVQGVVAKIVGIEGGEKAPFTTPPYYDPAALQGGRVILAAFSTAEAENLPQGRFRIARVHMQVTGLLPPGADEKKPEPEYSVTVKTAATSDATTIPVTCTVNAGGAK